MSINTLYKLSQKAGYFLHLLLMGRLIHNPYHCHYQITRRCNFKCLSCRVWKDEACGELDLDKIKILSANLSKIGIKSIVITGGEPLLRKDIPEVISIFKKEGFLVRLQTNGFLLNEKLLQEIFSRGLDDIYISLDTLDSTKFMHINGVESSSACKKVAENIKTASKFAKSYGAGVFLTTVLQPVNIDEIEVLNNFAKENKCLIGFYGLEVGDKNDENNIRSCNSSLLLDEEQKISLKESFVKIKELKKEKDSPVFSSNKLLDDYINFYGSKNLSMKWNCKAGNYYMEVLSDGSIGICNATPAIEEYNYETLPELYKSPDKEKIFKDYRKKCSGCICTKQLEYLTEDFSDIIAKISLYLRAVK